MANSGERAPDNNKMNTLRAGTKKEKTIWQKTPAEIEAEVDALLQKREYECPKRKKRHEKIRKHCAKKEEQLDKKHREPTPSVAPRLEASLKKATKQISELKELQSNIGESMEQLSSACAG